MTSEEKFEMEYRVLGKTGLQLSCLGLGAMTFDTVEKTVDFVKCARKYGINFFDNAEAYGTTMGLAERNFGKALKILQKEDPLLYRRSDLVITTKIYMGPQYYDINPSAPLNLTSFGVNEYGLTRKHLMEGINDSLKRLQLDYVDIVYAHRPDPLTSIEEIVRSFTQIIKSGKAFHWGTSMWKQWQVIEGCWVAEKYGLIAPVVEQPIYSMFTRDVVEYEYNRIYQSPYNIGTTIWNALDRGILSGKYNKGIPPGSRLSEGSFLGSFAGGPKYVTVDKVNKVSQLMKIANELDVTVAQLAIGWILKNKNVTVCMLGVTKLYQLEDSMGGIKAALKLDKKYMKQIETILNNKPEMKEIDRIWREPKHIISKL